MAKEKVIMVAVENIRDAIQIVMDNENSGVKMEKIIFIKLSNLTEYIDSPKDFTMKYFGDIRSGCFINFIYKESDKDFDASNLKFELVSALLKESLKKQYD